MAHTKLLEKRLWWQRTEWFQNTHALPIKVDIPIPVIGIRLCHHVTVKYDEQFIKSFSSHIEMIKVVSYCRGFFQRSKNTGILFVEGINDTSKHVIILIQITEMRKVVTKFSKLHNLNLFHDGNEIIKIGGRLKKSQLFNDQKYPMILQYKIHRSYKQIDYFFNQYLLLL